MALDSDLIENGGYKIAFPSFDDFWEAVSSQTSISDSVYTIQNTEIRFNLDKPFSAYSDEEIERLKMHYESEATRKNKASGMGMREISDAAKQSYKTDVENYLPNYVTRTMPIFQRCVLKDEDGTLFFSSDVLNKIYKIQAENKGGQVSQNERLFENAKFEIGNMIVFMSQFRDQVLDSVNYDEIAKNIYLPNAIFNRVQVKVNTEGINVDMIKCGGPKNLIDFTTPIFLRVAHYIVNNLNPGQVIRFD